MVSRRDEAGDIMTTARTTQDAAAHRPRPIWSFVRRLGVQAVMSVTVMAGLQLASVNGYDVRDLLPVRAPDAAGPVLSSPEPPRIVGVPARFDIPVQAGSALDRIQTQDVATAPQKVAAPASKSASPVTARKLDQAPRPSSERIAVPTPRPSFAVAERPPDPSRPSQLPFDVTPRGDAATPAIEVYGVAEHAEPEAPPMPIEVADARFHVDRLLPSGAAILTRTAEVTGSAAHAVTGTATRILDLVR